MIWAFSHCPVDHLEGDDGCAGCPALPDAYGKPAADHCEAVFIARQINRPAPSPKIILLAEAQNWRCPYCQGVMTCSIHRRWGYPQPTDATIDHVVARHAGGQSDWLNEIAACMACNSYRGHFSAILFWLLMLKHSFDRKRVRNILASLGKAGRRKMVDRYHRDQRRAEAEQVAA